MQMFHDFSRGIGSAFHSSFASRKVVFFSIDDITRGNDQFVIGNQRGIIIIGILCAEKNKNKDFKGDREFLSEKGQL